MSIDIQRELAGMVEQAVRPPRGGRVERDPEYRALKRLAERNRKHPPRTPHDALQHVVDVARELTDGTYGALAVTSPTDYVEGFIVSGMGNGDLARLKGPPQGHGPLGSMRQDGLPVHIDDLPAHAKAFGFPPKHPEMRELLGLPIIHRGEVRGALYVTDKKRGRRFDASDRAVLEAMAHHAGLIIAASWY